MPDALVSQREFARQCGKNHTWVARRIKEGKIPVEPDGKISLKAGLEAFQKLVEEQVAQLEAKKKEGQCTAGAIRNVVPIDTMDARAVEQAFAIAKLDEKRAVAELKALELKEKQGQVISVEEVTADAQKIAALVREKLLTIPVRYAGLLEGRSQREIEGILEQAVDEVLAEFQKSDFVSLRKN
ncbi:hypothetical protein [Turicimonas muris]|uniref:hypothetical protein n=1 Tax=Turicimonas muris TaxID=1796652 RepID=UPI0023F15F2B|nr:hypothetical protein [Turicimonas muris]